MLNKSLGINPNSTSADIMKNNNFIELSSFIYNRKRHDKTVWVDVDEINFIISIESILYDNNSKEKLHELINSNYSSLFDMNLIEEIRTVIGDNFDKICLTVKNGYSGLEYFILKHLFDYHLDMFVKDFSSGKLNNLIKLNVSKNKYTKKENLIVKVYPSKSNDDDNPVSYTISLLYLVLLHLFKQQYGNYDICNLIKIFFLKINPIITKIVYKIEINADDNYTWFTQLKQLKPNYKFFNIRSNNKQVRLLFRPRGHYLTSTLYCPVIHITPSDTNYRARFIKCTYTLGKDNKLTCKTTIVGKDMVDSVFSSWIDNENDLAPLFSELSDNENIYLANYFILREMLSFTEQHEALKTKLRRNVSKKIKENNIRIISGTKDKNISYLTNSNTIKYAFKDIEIPTRDDTLLSIIKEELLKLGQKNNLVDYIIIILELFKENDSVIDETLAPLDERTTEKIRKVIRKIRRIKLIPGFTLNEFYKEGKYAK